MAAGSRGGRCETVSTPPPYPYGPTWAVCGGVSRSRSIGHRCDVEATTGDVLAALLGRAAGGTGCLVGCPRFGAPRGSFDARRVRRFA